MSYSLSKRITALERGAERAFPEAPEKTIAALAVYFAHIGQGASMRAIARARGGAPSTVLRAVRKIEALRDDPLLDRALSAVEDRCQIEETGADAPGDVPTDPFDASSIADLMRTDESTATEEVSMAREDRSPERHMTKSERSALARMAEPDSFLLVAKGAEKAGVFCRKNNFRRPMSLISLVSATRFVANEWVKCVAKTELSVKYAITSVGRAALRRAEAVRSSHDENAFADGPSTYAAQHQMAGERRYANPKTGEIETVRVNLGESPLGWLAKRKDANGDPLLSAAEVEAGERLREDFEMAQMGPKIGQDWRRFLAPTQNSSGPGRSPSEGPTHARERVGAALGELGAGLADAALRICCFQEGLEATERRMGWSARSGKVVLKLALQRLVEHYGLLDRRKAA